MADSVQANGGSAASTPGAGPTGAAITVNGSGWQDVPDGTTVTFGYSTDPSCATSYTPVTGGQAGSMSSGAFSGWFRWPDNTSVGLSYTVCASTGTTIVAAGSYTVLSATPPQLSISASTLNVGQQASVTGSNFLPAQTSVSLVLQQLNGGTSVALGTVTSDANGAFSQVYPIPSNPTGPVVLIANSAGTPPVLTASATFIVYVPPVTPTPTPTTPTPTPTPGASPTPSPTPRPAPTPTPNNATPTAIQTQAATPTAAPAPTATPTRMAIVGSTTTPSTGNPITQRSISTPTSKPGSGHSDTITVTLIVGTLFLSLMATIAGLLFWKRRTTTKQQASFFVDAQAAQATSSWNIIDDPFNSAAPNPFATQPERSLASVPTLPGYPQPAQPAIPGQPHPPGRLCPPDSLPQGVSLLYTEPPTMRASSGMEVGAASIVGTPLGGAAVLGQTGGLVADGRGVDGLGGTAHAALLQSPTPGGSPASTANDLLHDPLFVAIMQQTRSGLFVLPGKGEE